MLCDIHINLSAPQYQSTAGWVKDRLLALTFIFLLLLLCVMDKGDLQERRGKSSFCSCPICFVRLYKMFWKVVCLVLGCFFFFVLFQRYQIQTSLVFLGDVVENWRPLGIKSLKLRQLKGEEDFSYNIFNLSVLCFCLLVPAQHHSCFMSFTFWLFG